MIKKNICKISNPWKNNPFIIIAIISKFKILMKEKLSSYKLSTLSIFHQKYFNDNFDDFLKDPKFKNLKKQNTLKQFCIK